MLNEFKVVQTFNTEALNARCPGWKQNYDLIIHPPLPPIPGYWLKRVIVLIARRTKLFWEWFILGFQVRCLVPSDQVWVESAYETFHLVPDVLSVS